MNLQLRQALVIDSELIGDDLLCLLLGSKPNDAIRQFSFSLDQISAADCKEMFRFEKDHLIRLQVALRLPDKMRCQNGVIFSGIEGLCILLRRLAYPNRLFDLSKIFPRTKPQLSMIINVVLNNIFNSFQHLVTSLDHWWLEVEYLQKYADAISMKGAPLQNCWGFIDGTLRPTCRPGRNQRELYNGHKRVHGIKFQSVVSANGLIANIFGPVAGRRHDCYMLSESNLLEQLEQKMVTADGDVFCLYGDPAYPLRSHLLSPYKSAILTPSEAKFNSIMSSLRVSVEWEFGKMVQLFAFLDFKKNLKLYLQPVAKYYIVGVILKNCHACLYECETSSYFDLHTPTLENYLHDEPE